MSTEDQLKRILNDIADLQQDIDKSLRLQSSLNQDSQHITNSEQDVEDFLKKFKTKLCAIDLLIDNYISPNNNNTIIEEKVNDQSPIGKIKIKDINTLLDPNILKSKSIIDDTPIVVSDSEEDNNNTVGNNKLPLNKDIPKSNKDNQSKGKKPNSNCLRRCSSTSRRIKQIYNSSTDDDDDQDTEILSDTTGKFIKRNTDSPTEKQLLKDKKFNWKCYIPLTQYPAEELKKLYLNKMEVTQISNSLGNLKQAKRKRKTSSASSNSTDSNNRQQQKVSKKSSQISNSSSSSSISNQSCPIDETNDVEMQPHSLDVADNEQCDSQNQENNVSDKPEGEGEKVMDCADASNNKQLENEAHDHSETDEQRDAIESNCANGDEETNKSKSVEEQEKDKSKENLNDSAAEKNRTDQLDAVSNCSEETSSTTKSTKSAKSNKKKSRNVLRSDSEESVSTEVQTKKGSSSETGEEDKTAEKEKKKPRRRVKKLKDSSDDDDEKSTRKQIRKVMTKGSLSQTTIAAQKDEEKRKERIACRQKKYNNLFDEGDLQNDTVDKVVLDFDEKTKEELLILDKEMVKHLKPHQARGIQFMFDACFESLEHLKNNKGSGCILAHCMGLGKTLQVIALSHALLTNSDKTNVHRILVVCPLSTVLNWVAEFRKWLPKGNDIDVYDLIAYKKVYERSYKVTEWMNDGGVLVIGYDMFRNLTNDTNKRINKRIRKSFQEALVNPGPDLVVCDEGHLLKNEKSSISISMNKIKTLRRIVLTGTPLQNNMKEYYCMVQFVRPNLLGTYKEYMNRFVNPITNGQYTDSTPHDISLMRKRSHVLHKMLDGIVQRNDYSVLAPFLPPKHEYVLFVKLTDLQMQLYEYYLTEKSQSACVSRAARLFADFQEFQRICTHPRVLLDKSIDVKIAREKKWSDEESEGSLKDFIDDGSEGESSSSSESSDSHNASKMAKTKRITRSNKNAAQEEEDSVDEPNYNKDDPCEWWRQFCTDPDLDDINHSSKLTLLFDILQQCELIGDKLLIFSQSLYSLNVIEYFLRKIDEATQNNEKLHKYSGSWALGLDYFRLDGSSSCDNRALWCKLFNDPENTRARLFLISTKAGGLGINLVAANRVIIFDVSWNPSHDIQSIYRVYRFGQTKPCYIYRFVTMGTMEMKVYERQVTKQAISKRVIDEQQIDRHYNQNDLQELYKYEPCPSERAVPLVPKDVMLAEMLQNEQGFIFQYHEHQTLLENKEDEELDEEERKAAWEEYENEKKTRTTTSGYLNHIPIPTIMNGMRRVLLQRNPALTREDLDKLLPQSYAMLTEQLANNDYSFYNKILDEIRNMSLTPEQKRIQEYMRLQQQQALAMQLQQMYNIMPSGLNPMIVQQMINNQNARAGSSQNPNIHPEIIEINDEP